ncbi:D-alanyl-D-alanine carboxypeptidase/D-alanyl-D-alanine endopeptidase [Terriglobus roseus]|uniref:D-alanyl-D-alanine carboxypeptidase / D-alanyl-D-alanine-endopeptidase (Penicillin-binding protein 4) n=1 Tax=Terriglobus roseus TaxID=392734 RepID=A0A1H4LKF2_9BACT|nr:D-alanyl-D-alanine carboxypeptidase/D-alanyl-D-alanine-endopeptidase [Terriglobus roseus]SEB71121.1 D-alanyl-D-alanine carboxypeptidase / D-alanyl-D-alanine-endopeptidase (penicillin-binding protein 4) [Terriglobus roseus]
MFRKLSVAIALGIALCAHAQTPTAPPSYADLPLAEQITRITSEPGVVRAHWGVSVTRLDGTPVAAMNDGQLFQPASNAKLFTTAAAMALLPMDDHLKTQVIASGNYYGKGTLDGNLVLKGVGDANFSGRPVPFVRVPAGTTAPHRDELRYIDELADKVKAAGITQIKGDIVGDDSLFPNDLYPADWSIDDSPWYYGAPINALMIADNAFNLKVLPGAAIGSKPTVVMDPALPFYTVDMQATTTTKGGESALDIQRSMGSRVIRIYGTLAIGSAPYSQDMSIAEPAEYAAAALKAALEARGVLVSGTTTAKHSSFYETSFTRHSTEPVNNLTLSPRRKVLLAAPTCSDCGTRVLAEHVGPLLRDDITITNKTSENQHAELFLRQLGFYYFGSGTSAQGARVVRYFLTKTVGIDGDDFLFFDGSGLSGHDLVTPRAATKLLAYAATQPWGAFWKDSFPVGGEDGTLRARFPAAPLKDHVFAKTGTLSEARGLSGYVDCASGQTLIFSIMVNAHTPRTSDDQKAMDRIVAAIAATN